MRRLALGLLLVTGCADRSAEVEVDYTQEVERLCEAVCTRGLECNADPPLETQEECVEFCTEVDEFYENSDCGEAFRGYYGCMGDIQTCEVWDAAHETVCADEFDTMLALKCGGREEEGG